MDRHGKTKRERTREEYQRMLNLHILPAVGPKRLADVRRSDVARLQSSLNRPVMANRTLEVVRLMFNKAVEWGELPEVTRNPASGIRPFAEKERERWLTPEERRALVVAIREEENPYIRGAIQILLLTGARKNEILRLKWRDVSFSRAELHLRETKTVARRIPLSREAIDVLEGLPLLYECKHRPVFVP